MSLEESGRQPKSYIFQRPNSSCSVIIYCSQAEKKEEESDAESKERHRNTEQNSSALSLLYTSRREGFWDVKLWHSSSA